MRSVPSTVEEIGRTIDSLFHVIPLFDVLNLNLRPKLESCIWIVWKTSIQVAHGMKLSDRQKKAQ
jgi:hypothetical protein